MKSTQKPVTKSPRKARGATRKVRIQSGAKNLTRQAGLIPVLKFHERLGLAGLLELPMGNYWQSGCFPAPGWGRDYYWLGIDKLAYIAVE